MGTQKKKQNSSIIVVIGAVLVIIVGGYLYFNSRGKENSESADVDGEYDTFAQCLYDSGLRMYGSIKCSFCARQRSLFENSFEYIREIECDPRVEGNEAERCIGKDISHTPTWILEDEDGNDVFRFESGIQTLEKLSEVSGCPLEKDI